MYGGTLWWEAGQPVSAREQTAREGTSRYKYNQQKERLHVQGFKVIRGTETPEIPQGS